MVIDLVSDVFGYNHPERRRIEHEIRRQIVEEAAKSKLDLIVTGVVVEVNRNLYKDLIASYRKEGGEVHLVQLVADRKSLLERVGGASRERKINSEKELNEFFNEFPECTEKFEEGEQLLVDTDKIQPEDAALKIAQHYKLK